MIQINTLPITPAAQRDIVELQGKIADHKSGKIADERFRLYRLTRGVYGQRQQGVQMFRIKVPYGKISPDQLRRLADLSETYTKGNLHITTRQNIQLHYVKLDDAPAIWEGLETVGLTGRESCGNTVRGITASPLAGIDPNELFDVTPYAQALFEYFLRNPICQDMGRKIKIAFSSSDEDAAFTYIHDFGFIPRIKNGQRGFKIIVGGGLGAQAIMGQVAYEFLPVDQIIPFVAAGLRVFDRYGERERRHKARLKFLVDPKKGLGIDGFLQLVEKEWSALADQTVAIDPVEETPALPTFQQNTPLPVKDLKAYQQWLEGNTFEQKQTGFFAVKVRVPLGDIQADLARKIALLAEKYASDDIRLTVNQGFVYKFIREENLPNIYAELQELGLADAGFDTLADITACPGTDTCNLGVTNSTALSTVLEGVIREEYPHLINERLIKIKISGCMNACGQHMVANIGFHGSSIKKDGKVAPAMQVVIGGGVDPDGQGYVAEKVIKLPTKQIPQGLRTLLDDYETNSQETEYFNEYFRRQGKIYFYDLLKGLADFEKLTDDVFQDWGKVEQFVPEIGVGECAGVALDLVASIIDDAKERHAWGVEQLKEQNWANVIYYAYNAFVIAAKAVLLNEEIHCNTHAGIIDDFESKIIGEGKVTFDGSFKDQALQINQHAPNEEFARAYLSQAGAFLNKVLDYRSIDAIGLEEDKVVVRDFYNA
ncbi:MAG: nitrite/sulfite reductase [Cyclobacteriaceae bacterium]